MVFQNIRVVNIKKHLIFKFQKAKLNESIKKELKALYLWTPYFPAVLV
jgi:hypothetical protein